MYKAYLLLFLLLLFALSKSDINTPIHNAALDHKKPCMSLEFTVLIKFVTYSGLRDTVCY